VAMQPSRELRDRRRLAGRWRLHGTLKNDTDELRQLLGAPEEASGGPLRRVEP
jgi:hypothetical protein